jgi:hypothetical protein
MTNLLKPLAEVIVIAAFSEAKTLMGRTLHRQRAARKRSDGTRRGRRR